MPVNRDQSITDNRAPGRREDSIADRGNVFSAGADARMNDVAERTGCNFSEVSRRSAAGDDPYGGVMARPWNYADHVAEHAEKKHTGGPGGSAFNRGSVLIQPPNNRNES